jgi:hypothetical protein
MCGMGQVVSPQLACHLIAKIDGVITAADYEKLKSLIDKIRSQREKLNFEWDNVFVYIDSPGGSVEAAMAIGRLLRKEQAYISIGYQPLFQEGVCYSACVLVFAGAVGRDTASEKWEYTVLILKFQRMR